MISISGVRTEQKLFGAGVKHRIYYSNGDIGGWHDGEYVLGRLPDGSPEPPPCRVVVGPYAV